ncbi:MAG TPA: hypothetical protein VMM18_08080 [Gemmatimonadaceae bacterium]|nr:hypothetical protein [Gemmatimonadaceae bacterium]
MRRIVLLVLLAFVATGCGFFRKTFGVSDPPAHTEPQTTSIWGEWVLATQADSTAFAGARQVELSLQPGTFRLRALYPAGDVVVTGTAGVTESGLLTLVPGTQTGQLAGSWRALTMRPGQPVSVLASSAGGSLVFAPDERSVRPSSVWHRREAAERAGTIGESAPPRPPDH